MKSEQQFVAEYHGVKVPKAPHLGPVIVKNLETNRYERREVEASIAMITSDDVVIEMGAGVVGAVIAKKCKPKKNIAFEANAGLNSHIRHLYQCNNLNAQVEVRNQIVLSQPDAPALQSFFVRGNYLGSGIEIVKGHKRAKEVNVPVIKWEDVKNEHAPTFLVIDIEGAELDFFRDADLSGIRGIVVELHRHIYHRPGMNEIRSHIKSAGFQQVDQLSGGGVFTYERV